MCNSAQPEYQIKYYTAQTRLQVAGMNPDRLSMVIHFFCIFEFIFYNPVQKPPQYLLVVRYVQKLRTQYLQCPENQSDSNFSVHLPQVSSEQSSLCETSLQEFSHLFMLRRICSNLHGGLIRFRISDRKSVNQITNMPI